MPATRPITRIRRKHPHGHQQAQQNAASCPAAILDITILRAKDLMAADRDGSSDPYVSIVVGNPRTTLGRTQTINHSLHPEWNQRFSSLPLDDAQRNSRLTLNVMDYDALTADDALGAVDIDLRELVPGREYSGWYSLSATEKGSDRQGHIEIRYRLDETERAHDSIYDDHSYHRRLAHHHHNYLVQTPHQEKPANYDNDATDDEEDWWSSLLSNLHLRRTSADPGAEGVGWDLGQYMQASNWNCVACCSNTTKTSAVSMATAPVRSTHHNSRMVSRQEYGQSPRMSPRIPAPRVLARPRGFETFTESQVTNESRR